MKRILLPTSMLVALAVAAPAQAAPAPGLAIAATTPAVAVVPTAVPPAVLPEAAAVVHPGLGLITAAEAGAPVGP
jgi:hypothetical protein